MVRKKYKNPVNTGKFTIWGGMWESNPRIPEPQSGVLITSPIPPCKLNYT